MNDRLKFRYWSKKSKCWFQSLILETDTGIPCWQDGSDLEDDILNEIVVEQCTGLKDKNGKLVFEGDVLQRMVQPYNQMGYKENYEVKELGYYLPQGETYGIFCVNLWGTDCEVIGNIHENPELLGGK